ncbi:ATP synthase subunit I [Ectobacillus antri]|jgi:ATP synthase protein I|uniref:ATP synthase subunit I n=1 Tax=Ectobacillus antri TaxID=2486280 RepID=A0ABT6H8G7_9BACI|nr:ATP synthase subunit I [Ectobacillus antri]MDG4658505.1 ATP synthase subunit I [Ectobacillus antri]MDG5755625.1 ATP synthase subunit I [Ectobacillus antri]
MITMHELVRRQTKYTLYLIALFVLGWGFTPYQKVFLGMAFGTAAGLLGLRLVAWKTDKLLDRVERGDAKVRFKANAVSTYPRLAAIGLGIIFAVRYQHMMEAWSFGLGLLTVYLVMIIDFIYLQYGREER